MHLSFPLALAAAMLLATAAGDAHAQWKWRDKAGQVHASDLPPPRDVPDKDVLQRPAAPVARRPAPVAPAASAAAIPGAPASAARADPELEARRRAADEQQRQRQAQEDQRLAAQRAENCDRARAQMRTLESGLRISRVNAQGEREFLDDKQIAAESQRARSAVAADCR